MRIGATDIRKRKRLFIGDLKPLSRGVAQVPTIKEKAPQIEDKQPQNENKAPINISAHKKLTLNREDLLEIVRGIIGEQNNLFKDPLIEEIASTTESSRDIAREVFNQMREKKIITETLQDRYHLTGSTPF